MNRKLYVYPLISLTLMLVNPTWSFCQEVNQDIVKAITSKDLSSLLNLYAPDAVCLPEYHPGLYGKKNIQQYYEERFKLSTVSNYTRSMHESRPVGEYVIETGTFSYTYQLTGKDPFLYSGKYIVLWKANKKHELKIISEIWGSDKYLERSGLDFRENNKRPYTSASSLKIKTDIQQEITGRNTFIAQCVKSRDGVGLATVYEGDAIYMPYYSPMVIGKKAITEYYVQHEDPAVTIDSVRINASRMVVAGEYVFVDGFYSVKWRAGENSGFVTGKSINIWRRNRQGIYMLYRQMTNHD